MVVEMESDEPVEEMKYHFIKSNTFKTIFCDGVFGGLRPDGNLHLTIYVERPAIPQMIVMEHLGGGSVKENESKRAGKDGIVCDVEASLLFDIDTAIELHAWLQAQLDIAEQRGLVSKEDSAAPTDTTTIFPEE